MREAPFVWSGPPSGREPPSRFQTDRLPKTIRHANLSSRVRQTSK